MLDNKQIWDSGYVNSDGVKETPKPYMYFTEYLKLGSGRSIRKLADKVRQKYGESTGKKKTIKRKLEKYSSKFDWVERAKAFDKQMFEDDLKLIRKKRMQLMLERLEEEQKDFKRNKENSNYDFNITKTLMLKVDYLTEMINNTDDLNKKNEYYEEFVNYVLKVYPIISKQIASQNQSNKTNLKAIDKFLDRYDSKENEVNVNPSPFFVNFESDFKSMDELFPNGEVEITY